MGKGAEKLATAAKELLRSNPGVMLHKFTLSMTAEGIDIKDMADVFPGDSLVCIGSGGFGQVFEVASKDVVVKITPVDPLNVFTSPARTCKHEYRIARAWQMPSCSHPCLISATQLFATTADPVDKLPAIAMVMPRAKGVTMNNFMQAKLQRCRPELRPCITSVCVLSLANAIHAMHSRGVIHRDLKANNIMVSPDNVFQIIDWGAAHVRGHAAVTSNAGTTMYCPPERLQDFIHAVPSTAEDWYAMGVMLYELMVGYDVNPYAPDKKMPRTLTMQALHSHLRRAKGRVQWPCGFNPAAWPQGMCELVQGLMHMDPARRWGMEEVLASPVCPGWVLDKMVGESKRKPGLEQLVQDYTALKACRMQGLSASAAQADCIAPLFNKPAVSAPQAPPAPAAEVQALQATQAHITAVTEAASAMKHTADEAHVENKVTEQQPSEATATSNGLRAEDAAAAAAAAACAGSEQQPAGLQLQKDTHCCEHSDHQYYGASVSVVSVLAGQLVLSSVDGSYISPVGTSANTSVAPSEAVSVCAQDEQCGLACHSPSGCAAAHDASIAGAAAAADNYCSAAQLAHGTKFPMHCPAANQQAASPKTDGGPHCSCQPAMALLLPPSLQTLLSSAYYWAGAGAGAACGLWAWGARQVSDVPMVPWVPVV